MDVEDSKANLVTRNKFEETLKVVSSRKNGRSED
jgi:hypothetical protein